MRCKRSLPWLLGGALALGAAAALAGEITLYEQPGFQGRFITSNDSIPNLPRSAFRDVAASATVGDGVWEACTDEYFHGRCTQLGPGQYASLDATLNGRVLSIRQVGFAQPAAPRVGYAPPAAAAPVPRAVLYEYPDFAGGSIALEGPEARNLAWVRFADRASSIRIEAGTWMFCTGPNFTGDCRTLGPGEYPRLTWNLDRQIASARVVSSLG